MTGRDDESAGTGTTWPEAPVDADSTDDTPPSAGAALFERRLHAVLFAIFAVAYVGVAVGWSVIVAGNRVQLSFGLSQFMYLIGLGLAIAAGPIWFLTATALAKSPQSRAVWMLGGLPVLMPWPLLVGL